MFRGYKTEDMPPHIYSLSQTAYRAMLEMRIDQSLIFMGRSGSRKTKSFKLSLYFLTLAAGKNFMDFFFNGIWFKYYIHKNSDFIKKSKKRFLVLKKNQMQKAFLSGFEPGLQIPTVFFFEIITAEKFPQ